MTKNSFVVEVTFKFSSGINFLQLMTSILDYIASSPKELVKYISFALPGYHINGFRAGQKAGLSLTSG